MKIKFLNYEVVVFIKNNREEIHKQLAHKSFVDLLDEQFHIDWYDKTKFIQPKIKFFIDKNINPKETDFQNSKKVYENLCNLTESQAAEERFWAGLAIESDNFNYLKYRWGDTSRTIRYRVVYHASGKRGIMYHGLARLWWFAHLTFDKSLADPYELTEFCFKYPHILEKMLYRNYSNSRNIRNGIIKGIKEHLDNGGKYRTKDVDELFNYISALSGVHMLDAFEEMQIKEITVKRLDSNK